jgi:DNA-binding protein H-NS
MRQVELSLTNYLKEKPVADYKELRAQAQELLKQAEVARRAESAAVVADIRAKMGEYGITVEDLKRGLKQPKGAASAARYRNPATGETWSGRGRAPKWMVQEEAAGQPRDAFLIG